MRKFVFIFFMISSEVVIGQNLQLHYDLGEGRKYFTSTVEMFKPDTFGSTFFFIDMDYDGADKGISLSYWEVARDLKFWDAPITMHVEYNGGNMVLDDLGIVFPNNWLFGGAYSFSVKQNFIITQFLYKTFSSGSKSPDFQWTNVWVSKPMFNNKVIFTGYIDIWSQDKLSSDGKLLVLQAEPQLWHTLYTKGWWIGTEVEISKNFLHTKKFEFMPTICFKYEY